MTISRYGLSVRPEPGWQTQIFRRLPQDPHEVTHPVLHACTRALPAGCGDFGGGVIDRLDTSDVFVSLIEFGSDVAGEGLFAPVGMPRLAPSQFGPNNMPRAVAGRSAAQHFFTVGDRAFCLFVVVGSHARRMALVPRAARLLSGVSVSRRVLPRRMGLL